MEIRNRLIAVVFAVVFVGTFLLFGTALLGASFGEEPPAALIDMPEATRLVLAEFPNARIVEIELDREHGHFVYEVELITTEGQKKEVHINATTGRIEKVERD
ncbi:MAG: PepSY domain-containing protein [Nitrospira sp.]|nr:PepSY domain-containing protein [Nitrospira sp.]